METTKTVYSYSRETLAYVGPLVLNESDMSPLEPGVWHIPGNCLEVQPPDPPEGMRVVCDGQRWVLEPIPEPEQVEAAALLVEPQAPALTLAERINLLEAQVELHMHQTAASYGYNTLDRAISYAEEQAVPQYWAEGRAFRAWRSKVFAAFYARTPSYTDETLPTLEGLLPELPVLDMVKAKADWLMLEQRQAEQAALDEVAQRMAAGEHVGAPVAQAEQAAEAPAPAARKRKKG